MEAWSAKNGVGENVEGDGAAGPSCRPNFSWSYHPCHS